MYAIFTQICILNVSSKQVLNICKTFKLSDFVMRNMILHTCQPVMIKMTEVYTQPGCLDTHDRSLHFFTNNPPKQTQQRNTKEKNIYLYRLLLSGKESVANSERCSVSISFVVFFFILFTGQPVDMRIQSSLSFRNFT